MALAASTAATNQAAKPAIVVAAQAKAPARLSAADYAEAHKTFVQFLSRFQRALSDPEVATPMGQLATELSTSATYRSAFQHAGKIGDADAAKTASDSFVQSAQKIVRLASALNVAVAEGREALSNGVAEFGASAVRMLAEPDVAPLLKDISETLQPLNDANLQFGHVYAAAEDAAKLRFPAVQQELFAEQLHDEVLNYLQGQWAKQ